MKDFLHFNFLQKHTAKAGTKSLTLQLCLWLCGILLCGTVLAQPANNDCAGAITLTPGAAGAACAYTAGTSTNATQSLAGGCGNADDDVWYSFTATNNTHTITAATDGLRNMVFELRSGACNGVAMACVDVVNGNNDTEVYTANDLVVGQTYLIRVYSDGGNSNQGTFDICITTPAPPANDDCTGATSLTPGNTCVNTAGTTIGATSNLAGCSGTSSADVWYSFVATSTNHSIATSTAAGLNLVSEVFSGSCAALSSIQCQNAGGANATETITRTDFVPGQTYFVRVYNAVALQGTFSICITTPVPANNDCAGAITLTPSANCVPTLGGTGGATPTTPATCGGNADDDVWYQFTATSANHTVTLSGGTIDGVLQVYSGLCAVLTSIGCTNTSNVAGGTESIALTGLTAGFTYRIRVYSANTTQGSFNICVSTPPLNDNCAGAFILTPNVNCVNTAGTTVGGTQTLPGVCGGNADDDVWYRFTATSTSHTVTVSGGTIDGVVELLSGACNGTSVSCSNSSAIVGGSESIIATGLTVGQTYRVRVYSANNTQGTFNICVSTPPVNDNCTGAITLTPAASATCGGATAGTTVGGTQSLPGVCAGNSDDDVWYQFTATGTSHNITVSGGTINAVAELFSGTCGTPASITCSNTTAVAGGAEVISLTNFIPGDVYFVRVFSGDNSQGTFNICVTTITPVNNDCSGAIALTPSLGCNPTSGGTGGATQSLPGCTGNADDDVWYSFTATSTTHEVRVEGGTINAVAQLFSGTCAALTSITCANASAVVGGTESIVNTGLTIGQTYFVRVYSFNNIQGTFDICIITPPPNDNCSGAVSLTPAAAGGACTVTTGTTVGATQTIAGVCGGNADDDVWYSFTATSATHTISVSGGTIDAVVQLLSGACNGTNITCSNASAVVGVEETILRTDLVVGQTYFVRVYSADLTEGTFNICITTPPANNDCAGAIALPSNTACSVTTGTTGGATQSLVGCAGNADDDVWYSFVAQANTHTITVSGGTIDAVVELRDGNAGCTGVNLNCSNTSAVAGGTEAITATTLVVGRTYFVRIHSNGAGTAAQGTFDLCITHPAFPANDACANAENLTVGGFCAFGSNVNANTAIPNGTNTCGSSAKTVWYTFTATAATHVVSLDIFDAGFNGTFELYTGTCATALTAVAGTCTNATGAGVDELGTFTGLTIGTQYFIRVNGVSATDQGSFCIRVYKLTPPNDDCTGATPLTMNASCTNGSNNNATATGANGGNNCPAGVTASNTVWYSFVATQTSHYIHVKNEDINFNQAFAVFSGTCAGTLSQIACVNNSDADGTNDYATIPGLTIGATYLVRVNGATTTELGNFCIRVMSSPPNDNCANAINLTVDGNCTAGYNYMATAEAGNPTPSCALNSNTVWYRFTADATTHFISLRVSPYSGLPEPDLGFAVFTGTCGGLTEVPGSCTDAYGREADESRVLNGLTIGQQYYVMVTGYDSDDAGNFCIQVKGTPPNDECTDATALTVNSICTSGTTVGATSSGTNPSASCIDRSNSVWYSFTATNAVQTINLTAVQAGVNLGFALFSGNCTNNASLTEIACSDAQGNGTSETLTLTSLTPGTTYYLMVAGNNNTEEGSFCIQVLSPPANDEICNATPLTMNYSCMVGTNTLATNQGTNPAVGCGDNTKSVWYRFTATSTSHRVAFTARSTGANTDLIMSTFSSSTNTCTGTLTLLGCQDTKADANGEDMVLTGLTPGLTYYVMISGDLPTDEATFCISVTNAHDLCSAATPIAPNSECTAAGNTSATTTGTTDGTCQTPQNTVWFTFVPTITSATVEVRPDPLFDAELTVFSATGSCTGFTQLACVDAGGFGVTETAVLSGLTPGQTYYFMVDGESAGAGSFCTKVTLPIPCGANEPPADACTDAPLIDNLNGYCGATDSNYQRDTYNNMKNIMCNTVSTEIENNSFLKFTAASVEVTFEYSIVSSSPNGGAPCDQGIQINVFSVTGNDCTTGTWTPVTTDCINPSGGVGSTGTLTAKNLVPGQIYYIMFDGYAGDECGFLLRAPEGGGVLLPVDLVLFTGTAMAQGNMLNWKTANEHQLREFILERSHNGMQFRPIAVVKSQEGRNTLNAYQYLDTEPFPGKNYYRIRSVEQDGREEYSQIIQVERTANELLNLMSLYPNPAQTEINYLIYCPSDGKYLVEVISTTGIKMLSRAESLSAGTHELKEQIGNLPAGLYILRFADPATGHIATRKFIRE